MAVMGKKEGGEETEKEAVAVVGAEKMPEEETKPVGENASVLDTTEDHVKQLADADADRPALGGESLANKISSGAAMEKDSEEEMEKEVVVVYGEKKADEETKPAGGEGVVMEKEVAVVNSEKKVEEETKPASEDALVLDTTEENLKQLVDADSIRARPAHGGENPLLANSTSSGALMEKKESGEEMGEKVVVPVDDGEKKPGEETKPTGKDASVLDTDHVKADTDIIKSRASPARGGKHLTDKSSSVLMGRMMGNRFAALSLGDNDGDDSMEANPINGVEGETVVRGGKAKKRARKIYVPRVYFVDPTVKVPIVEPVYLCEEIVPFPPSPSRHALMRNMRLLLPRPAGTQTTLSPMAVLARRVNSSTTRTIHICHLRKLFL